MKILVTGSSGFLGAHVVDALRTRGDEVVLFDKATGQDITDRAAVERAVEGVDAVVHSASIIHTKWSQLDLIRRVNVGGTENVLAACEKQGVERLVYVSSASVVYQGEDIRSGDESLPHATRFAAPYAETKSVAEKMVLAQSKVPACALRPHSIFGPGDTRLVPAILEKAKKGKLRFSVGKRGKRTDFTYVANVVDAVLLAIEKLPKVAGRPYFITNGEPMDFWVFVRRIVEPFGYATPILNIPYPIAYGAAWARETIDTLRGGTLNSEESLSRFTIDYLCTDHFYSIDKAKTELGYEPKISMQGGIERTIADLTRAEAA